jgi:hypothetical protein
MVVPVLMTSCQVSENLKRWPEAAHTMMDATAREKTHPRPTSREIARAITENRRLRGPFLPSGAFKGAAGAPFLLEALFAISDYSNNVVRPHPMFHGPEKFHPITEQNQRGRAQSDGLQGGEPQASTRKAKWRNCPRRAERGR